MHTLLTTVGVIAGIWLLASLAFAGLWAAVLTYDKRHRGRS